MIELNEKFSKAIRFALYKYKDIIIGGSVALKIYGVLDREPNDLDFILPKSKHKEFLEKNNIKKKKIKKNQKIIIIKH